jgi:hypothetical protein
VVGVVGGVLLIGGIVVAVVLLRRRKPVQHSVAPIQPVSVVQKD